MIKKFLIKNLISIHSGGLGGKIWSSAKLAAVPAAGISLTEKFTAWYIDSQVFIIILVAMLFVDLILGVWKHWKLHTFSFKSMIRGFMEKIVLLILFYFISEALIQIISDADLDSVYIKVPLKLIMFFYLAGNALVNMGIISGGRIPSLALLSRIEKFNKTLNIEDLNLKPQKDETDTNTNNPV